MLIRNPYIQRAGLLLGVDSQRTSHREKWLSAGGAFVGILAIVYLSRLVVDDAATPLIVASMGAAAVLVFAVPYGALPLPWPLLAGNTVSALIGVGCAHWIAPLPVAAAAAVGLSLLAMYYLRCVHPPGGASALFAVIGGKAIVALNIQYAFVPVFVNALCLMVAALLYNGLFPARRRAMKDPRRGRGQADGCGSTVTRADVSAALEQLDTFIDITEEELYELVQQAITQANRSARVCAAVPARPPAAPSFSPSSAFPE